jgi:anti-sigma B factor antagonist
MTINKTQDGKQLTLSVDGRLDNNTAAEFLSAFNEAANESDDIALDLAKLVYLSSAGLRVIASAQKTMNKKGKLTIRNVTPDVMEVFDLIGLLKILNIES